MDKRFLKIIEILLIAVAFLGTGYIGFIAWALWALEIIITRYMEVKKSGNLEDMKSIKNEIPIYIGIFIFFIVVKFLAGTL